jgi:hypothetical protein
MDWIQWSGGECPIRPETLVKVRFRHNDTEPDKWKHAARYHWHHHGGGGDIIAYRLASPSTAESSSPEPDQRSSLPVYGTKTVD